MSLPTTDRLTKARMDVILFAPFYGSLLMRLAMIRDDSVPTMCTDGKAIRYSDAFVSKLSDSELRGVLAHEVCHCAQGHLWRMGGRDPKKWNMATDYQVNEMLETYVKEDREAFEQRHGNTRGYAVPWTLPEDALREQSFAGLSSEEIYARLPDDDGGDGESEGDGTNQPNPSTGSQGYTSPGEFVAQPAEPGDRPEGGEEDWTLAVVQAAATAKQRGHLPASLQRFVKELVKPKVSWREVLREFLRTLARDDYSWREPNRRYLHTGIVLPSLRSERMGRIAIAVDNSGSIDDKVLAEFQAEVQSALDECSPEALEVIYCDASIQKVEEFIPGDAVGLESLGGGGTDFRPVFEHLDQAEEPPVARPR